MKDSAGFPALFLMLTALLITFPIVLIACNGSTDSSLPSLPAEPFGVDISTRHDLWVDYSDVDQFTELILPEWEAESSETARYNVHFDLSISSERECGPYGFQGLTLTYKRVTVEITITDLTTDSEVASTTRSGRIPAECPQYYDFQARGVVALNANENKLPDSADVGIWLRNRMISLPGLPSTATPTPTRTPSITNTPRPTRTPSSTRTPRPTSTINPLLTPSLTPTSTLTITPDPITEYSGVIVEGNASNGILSSQLDNYTELVPAEWNAVSDADARYSIHFRLLNGRSRECGPYSIFYLDQQSIYLDVVVTDLVNDSEIASERFQGELQGNCPRTHSFSYASNGLPITVEEFYPTTRSVNRWLTETVGVLQYVSPPNPSP